MKGPRLLILALAFSGLFFGWRAYEAWTRPVASGASAPPGSGALPIGVAPADAPSSPMDLSTPVAMIVARPLFRPDRKPYSEEAASASKRNYDAEIARFTLLGILEMGKEKKGIVVGKGGAAREERWEVGTGDTLPGFNVKEIRMEGVTLVADDREFLLPLYAGGPKVTAGQAPVRTDIAPQRPPVSPPQQPSAGQAGSIPPAAQPVRATPPPPPAVASPPVTGAPPAAHPPVYGGRRQIRPYKPEQPAVRGGR